MCPFFNCFLTLRVRFKLGFGLSIRVGFRFRFEVNFHCKNLNHAYLSQSYEKVDENFWWDFEVELCLDLSQSYEKADENFWWNRTFLFIHPPYHLSLLYFRIC